MRNRCTGILLSALLAASCSEPGDQVLDITATGDLLGVVFLDRDGDLTVTANVDSPIPRLHVSIVARSGAQVATAMTDSVGRFRAEDLPAGSYRVIADSTMFGDSVRVLRVDNPDVTVGAQDSAITVIAVGYPRSFIRDIRARAPGRRVALNAIALNSWVTFGDSSVHLADSSGVVRAVAVRQPGIQAGDSVRVLATVATQNDFIVLKDVALVWAKRGTLPAPRELTTAAAALGGGALDGGQVHIRNALVTDGSSLVGGDLLLTVNDGSGPLHLLIDANANIHTALPIAIGAELDISGLLVPMVGGAQMLLKPRVSADVGVRYRPISVAAARARPSGQYAVIQAVALNDLGIFGDLGVHVADATGAIRVRSAQPGFISAGDSVSVLGQIARLDGQPALVNATVSVITRTVAPAPRTLSTQAAAGADNNRADAALVKVMDVLVKDTVTIGAEFHVFVDDSTGVVEVVIDRDAVINMPPIAVNSRWDVTGLLVHSNVPGVWWIKPRSRADLTAR